ncbi:DUF4302 domain-containing protein [Mariniflexile gromovii]|uniref:DUF4302 domain-containing protein n=1 Tax=Mariniflexile gromovii TaxID=362523 RepID=A0ABS4BT78_9FLAO|nr:DUF4302 domain-containing protein [Mariniflexile gromovii]MBP0903252.1 DUF4302 domain-containing protein [Mariniflexile gromovii]
MEKTYKLIKSIFVLVVLVLAVSCTDNDVEPLFEQSINERTEALKKEYLDILKAPTDGWIGYYSPNETFGAYTVLMKFDGNGDVDIKSDYEFGDQDNKITYRIDKTLKIELVLESFSVFSSIFSLNNNNNGGEFVFNILSATADEVVLESKLDFGDDITILTLRKATPADFDFAPVYASANKIAGECSDSVFRNILFNNNAIASFSFNADTRLITLNYFENDVRLNLNVPAVVTPTGFSLLNPVTINNITISSFTFDETSGEYINAADNLRLINDDLPLRLTNDLAELNAPNRLAIFANEFRFGANPLTSCAWDAMIQQVDANLRTQGFTYTGVQLRTNYNATSTTDANSRIVLLVERLSDGLATSGSYYIKVENKNNLVFVTSTGFATGNGNFFAASAAPLLNFFLSTKGLVYTDEGSFSSNLFSYSNEAGTFTSVDNPSLRTYGLFYQ